MKKTTTLIAAAALFSMVGCGGGGGSPTSSSSVKTGTGYYLDSAVVGVDYVCGSQTGKTGADGKFTFEKGKECKFALAGVPLRTTEADELVDGKKIVEDNLKVAKFLQSIDSDGDLSNGIQITDEVIEALTKALEETQSEGQLPEEDTLTEVVATVGQEVAGVSGEVRTDEEVQEHLTQTKTEVTKELLAGKTFYTVGEEEDKFIFFKIVVDKEATLYKVYNLSGALEEEVSITITGNKLIFTDDTDGSYTLVSQENGYIFADDRNADGSKDGIGHRLYTSKSDAQAYFDSLNGGSSTESGDDLKFTKEILSTNPWYRIEYTEDEVYCNGKFAFDTNENLTASWKENGSIQSASANYSIVDGKLVTTHDGKTETETLSSKSSTILTANKIAKNAQTGEYLHTMGVKYFKNRQDAIDFGNSKGVDCSSYLP